MDKNTGQSQEPIEAQIVKREIGPQAVMQTPKQLQSQMERDVKIREIINSYIKNNMVSGKDYGTINIAGKESKPSLFKPGAEKFCGLFKIRATFRKDSETVDMLGNTPGILAYICELVDSQGRIVGEGRGTAKTDPINGKDFDINKQVKIAQKRAQIDAVLRTGGLSDFFTQDMEDAPKDLNQGSGPRQPANNSAPSTQKQLGFIKNLANERFATKEEFEAFATEKVGASSNLTLKQASDLIAELYKVEKLPEDEDHEG